MFFFIFQIQAEEICALVDQCFQLVYTEAAIQFIDRKLTCAFTTSVTSSNTQSEPQGTEFKFGDFLFFIFKIGELQQVFPK